MKKSFISILIVLSVIAAAFCYVFNDIMQYGRLPAGAAQTEVFLDIGPGQHFNVTSELLHQKGLIKHPLKFKLLARIKNADKKIRAGEYCLSATMPPNEILEIMTSGKIFLRKLTVPEGDNIYQIAAAVSRSGLGTESDFLQAATDPDLVRKKGIEAQTFEGYLFPDTYYFPKGVKPEKIIATMVKRFHGIFSPEWEKQAQSLNLSVHEAVTLASVIEKETGVAEERPLISSVFHNRLKKGMRLESDPTVIYGIKDFDGNITRKHLETLMPYNTYKIKGLPPGPIANPGQKAIEAALYPADTAFLFFVSKNDHTHQFSTNLTNHSRAVEKYQLSR